MKKSSLIPAAALLIIAVACNGNKSVETEAIETTEAVETAAPEALVMTGTFEGTLPAADCEGIKTILTVNPDSTYTLVSEYLGVKDGKFETSGVYHLIGTDLIELITPSSGDKTYYKRLDKGFMLSDSIGSVNQGELAEYYILKMK